jgi:dolichyl-diphosphooligosaccharide--protein glycosyltransferase
LNNVVGVEMSLNDVCCYVPCWGGMAATLFMGLWATECSGSPNAGVISALVFAIIPVGDAQPASGLSVWMLVFTARTFAVCRPVCGPSTLLHMHTILNGSSLVLNRRLWLDNSQAHIMRSVGGGYDNESVAMTCMMMTFYFWVRACRDSTKDKDAHTWNSVVFGVLSGLAYICMAAAWGGYVFVLNMIGVHVTLLVLVGRFSKSLFVAYSLFYVIGTTGATFVPVIGWTPLKSLEQLGCLGIFGGRRTLLKSIHPLSVRSMFNVTSLFCTLQFAVCSSDLCALRFDLCVCYCGLKRHAVQETTHAEQETTHAVQETTHAVLKVWCSAPLLYASKRQR